MGAATAVRDVFHPRRPVEPALDAYAGRYRTEAGVTITVGAERSTLWAQIRGLPPILFLSQGEGVFLAPENGLVLAFARPAAGTARGFVLRQSGAPDLKAERITLQLMS
jgi:hypothetical protein